MIENYANKATHHIESVDLYLRDVVMEDGKLVSAYVVNGDWYLKKHEAQWLATDAMGVVHSRCGYVEYEVVSMEDKLEEEEHDRVWYDELREEQEGS